MAHEKSSLVLFVQIVSEKKAVYLKWYMSNAPKTFWSVQVLMYDEFQSALQTNLFTIIHCWKVLQLAIVIEPLTSETFLFFVMNFGRNCVIYMNSKVFKIGNYEFYGP